jgi:uncharacterized protein YrrD
MYMLIKAKELNGFELQGRDGGMGKVKEFYFDDQHWTIRYLVAETGNWLSDRQVLVSPYALLNVNKTDRFINVDLTKKQIEDSPPLRSDKPVSKQFEEEYYGFYGWPMYDGGPHVWGPHSYIERDRSKWGKSRATEKVWDHHLRSSHDVSGHAIQATDGEIGHVDDFIIDDETWSIRYLVIDTHNWLPDKKVLVSPLWIEKVSWTQSKVFVNLLRETIEKSPPYSEADLITREYELGLHKHYNRLGYWSDEHPR